MRPLISHHFSLSNFFTFLVFLNGNSYLLGMSMTRIKARNNGERAQTGLVYLQFADQPMFSNQLITKTKHNTGRLNYVTFYDNSGQEGIRFEEIAQKRKVSYSTQSDWVMIRRYLSFFEFQDFLVHKGDSLVMSFDLNKSMIVKHSTMRYAPQDLTVETLLNKKYSDAYLITGMVDDTRMVAYKYFYDDPKESERQLARKGYEKGLYLEKLENLMGGNLLLAARKLKDESQQMLDSLRNYQQISEPVYDFYQRKYANLLLKLEIMSGSIDSTTAANELNNRIKNQGYQYEYLDQCLDNYAKKYITSNISWTTSDQLNLRDTRESFALVKNSSLLSPMAKNQLLFILLAKIDVFFPDNIDTYLKSFVNAVTDNRLIELAQAKYQKDKLINVIPSNLHLLTFDRQQTSIENVLESKKGKVVYIDFWASWCIPCLEEMKHSKNLLQAYNSKKLEVVFFSLDDTYSKWSRAAERLEINSLSNSFQIFKPNDSKFFKQHKIKSIPRYMVVDRNGQIISADAPRPSDPKTRDLLNDLLRE